METNQWQSQDTGMEIQIAVSKSNKFDSDESGDTLEFIERPNGGISVVLADALTSGKNAKLISSSVVHKVITFIAEGIKDGVSARAVSDFLFTEHTGKVSAYLDILSVDLQSETIVLSRNNPTPVFIARSGRIECIGSENNPIGVSRSIKPSITEIPLENSLTIVIYTDGILSSGKDYGIGLDVCTLIESMLDEQEPNAQTIADTILTEAIRLDQGHPNDDMSVVVLRVFDRETDNIRRMNATLPIRRSAYTAG